MSHKLRLLDSQSSSTMPCRQCPRMVVPPQRPLQCVPGSSARYSSKVLPCRTVVAAAMPRMHPDWQHTASEIAEGASNWQPSAAQKQLLRVNKKRLRACSRCGDHGHMSNACPQRIVPLTGIPGCLTCGRPGHAAKDCPFRCRPHLHLCQICGQRGHKYNICPHNPKSLHGWAVAMNTAARGAQTPRTPAWRQAQSKSARRTHTLHGRVPTCRMCGGTGHYSRTCPGQAFKYRNCCYNCGSVFHVTAQCPEPSRPLRRCSLCKQAGHSRDFCPHNPAGVSRHQCSRCGKAHHRHGCPHLKYCYECNREHERSAAVCEACGSNKWSDKFRQLCKHCGELGHYSSSCPERHTCDVCGGHHRRYACPQVKYCIKCNTEHVRSADACSACGSTEWTSHRRRRCGHCGELGHYKSRCPLLHGEPDTTKFCSACNAEHIESAVACTQCGNARWSSEKAPACGSCGAVGHNACSCPERRSAARGGHRDEIVLT